MTGDWPCFGSKAVQNGKREEREGREGRTAVLGTSADWAGVGVDEREEMSRS